MRGLAIIVLVIHCFLPNTGQQYGRNNQYGNNNNIRDRQLGGNIRCYICSSIEQANCGDPFFGSGSITAKSCNQYSTNSVHMCFKAVKWFGGGYVTTRGCAPFDTETFSANLQRGMAGTYWKGYDAFSLCENTLCNPAPSLKSQSILINVILFSIVSYFSRL